MNKQIFSLLAVLSIASPTICAQEAATPNSAAAGEGVLKEDFQKFSVGKTPDELFVVQGTFSIAEDGANKVLQCDPEPLDDGVVLMGKAMKSGGTVKAKIKASSKKRTHPRFGVGLGGTSGFRLRVVGAEGVVELTREDARVANVDHIYKSDQWTWLELTLKPAATAGEWQLEGRVWLDGQSRPEMPTISLVSKDAPPNGKASVQGTPFSGKPIAFDEVEITPAK